MSFDEPDLWRTLAKFYNKDAENNEEWQPVDRDIILVDPSKVDCVVSGFYDKSYGKFSQEQTQKPQSQIIVEVRHYLQMMAQGAPASYQENAGFVAWLMTENKSLDFVQLLMMTLPSPRHEYYQNPNYEDIQWGVLDYSNEIVDALGLYPIKADLQLLGEMEIYQYQLMFIGLIFDVIVILFVIVAILLIYSLLLISVETKTFEIGIMRLVGLSKRSFIGMIFTQSYFFVLPAVLCGFALYLPAMILIYSYLFTEELGFHPDYKPGMRATI